MSRRWRPKDEREATRSRSVIWDYVPGRWAGDLSRLEESLEEEIAAQGWKIRRKKGGGRYANMGTTGHRTLWLPYNHWHRSVGRRCRLLAHELEHIAQRRDLGNLRFDVRWLTLRGRAALEASAYRASVWCMRVMDSTPSTIDGYIRARVERVPDVYKLGRIRNIRGELDRLLREVAP